MRRAAQSCRGSTCGQAGSFCHHIHKPHPFAELLAEQRGQVADPGLRDWQPRGLEDTEKAGCVFPICSLTPSTWWYMCGSGRFTNFSLFFFFYPSSYININASQLGTYATLIIILNRGLYIEIFCPHRAGWSSTFYSCRSPERPSQKQVVYLLSPKATS